MLVQMLIEIQMSGLPLLQERDKRVRLLSRIQNVQESDTTGVEQKYEC